MRNWILVAALMTVVAACSPTPPVPSNVAPATQRPTSTPSNAHSPASAILVVSQAFVGEGLYTEGAYAYTEFFDATGALVERAETTDYHLEQELARFTVDAGRYDLRSYVRLCEAACPALDAPSAACEATIELKPGDEMTVRIERTLRGCEVRSL